MAPARAARGASMQDQQLAGRQEGMVTERDVAGSVMEGAMNGTTTSTPARQYDYAYYKSVFGDHPMPFAYLDLDLLEQNIRQVVARAREKRVRLASKSLRSVAIIRRILASNPYFQGIMCFTAM